ncbi:hypothetical protein ACFYYM_39890 [Streptomyces erythrochromogenes]
MNRQPRPTTVCRCGPSRRPEDPLTPEEINLPERLQAQPHRNVELW